MKKYELFQGEVEFATPEDESVWFGYYNYSPIDISGNRMLAHKTNFEGRMFSSDDWAEVGWYNLKDGQWHSVGKTNTVNWQQGAMLQWRPNHPDELVYNCLVDGKYGAKIVNVVTGEEKCLNWPIYGLTPDGNYSITLNFERLAWTRAYHYETIRNESYNVPVPEDDGIFLLDLENNTVKRILSIAEIIDKDYQQEFDGRFHWVEHIIINKSGTRFAFYHRFSAPNGFLTRLMTAGIDGSDLYVFKEWKEIGWSHLGWIDNERFVAFGYERVKTAQIYDKVTSNIGMIGKIIRKVYRRAIYPLLPPKMHEEIAVKSCYEEYIDHQGKIKRYNHKLMFNDGHPSFTHDGRYMLSDTYALEDQYRYLYLYDLKNDSVKEIGKFFSPFNNCGYRSDLHPRFSPDEKKIVIDSAHNGHHGMLLIKIGENDD